MAQVEVDQAVFTSSGNGAVQGYQLVAKSAGIDERAAHVLRLWSPTHNGLASSDIGATSLSYFPIDKNRIAIGRTIYGLPEYSSRGSLQTVTLYLVTSTEHLSRYDGDVWIMASIARSLGYLRFDRTIAAKLSMLMMPTTTVLGGAPLAEQSRPSNATFINKAHTLMGRGRSVAIVGEPDPIPALRQLIFNMSVSERLSTSFATGLSHSSQRKFRLQFFLSTETDLRYDLSRNDISIVQREQKLAAANNEVYAWQ